MSQKIAITGMGIISSIGNNVEENFISLQSGKHGISDIRCLKPVIPEISKQAK
jgi:3-oxoacyl-[acyl-carrier-protein] synthase-1